MRAGLGAREHDEVVAVEAAGMGDAVAHRGALPPPVLPRAVQEAAARRVQPMHDMFVEPSRAHADVLLTGGGHNQEAIQSLADRVLRLLAG